MTDRVIIENAGPKISVADIEKLELEFSTRLPSEYTEFLLSFNGGAPIPDVIDVPDAPMTPTDVQVFFGIDREVKSSELFWTLSLVRAQYGYRFLLPIACDSGGNYFCLKAENGRASSVVYWTLRDNVADIYPVAESFSAFMKKIRDYRQ